MEHITNEIVMSGTLGLVVGDALGVPVEFVRREIIKKNPVNDMIGYGTYNMPPGTWSDDSSMALCLLDSLSKGLDYSDIMQKFLAWLNDAEYTPYGKVFDVGRTCMTAVFRFPKGTQPIMCGGTKENENGNGSLMRILPIVFYLTSIYGNDFSEHEEAFEIIHNVSALTHAHARSKTACGIYISIAGDMTDAPDVSSGVQSGLNKARTYYESKKELAGEFEHYCRIYSNGFADLPESEIKSSGYVVDTLEAALWCLLNTDTYENCVLKAVNLGQDTDSVAAVAGGLAGLYYGLDAIPVKWLEQIARLDYIKGLCEAI